MWTSYDTLAIPGQENTDNYSICFTVWLPRLRGDVHPKSNTPAVHRLDNSRWARRLLTDRIVSGPHPAVEGLDVRTKTGALSLQGGVAARGMVGGLEVCQQQIDTWGLSAFLPERSA